MARRRHHHGSAGIVTPPSNNTLTVAFAGAGEGRLSAPGIDSPRKPWRGGGMLGLPGRGSDMATVGYEWYYNWSWTSGFATNVPFVPMAYNAAAMTNGVPASIMGGSSDDFLLGFNEPDSTGMSVSKALDLWPQLVATGRSLGSPATTTGGTAWRNNFINGLAARGLPEVDFICVHWYGDFSNPANLTAYLNNVHANHVKQDGSHYPIWLTEFDAYNGSLAQNTNFIRNVGPLLAAMPFLQRVGWFANRSLGGSGGYNNVGLVESTNTLTSVGSAYKNWPRSVGDKIQTYPADTIVHLTATPYAGSSFDGWSGDIGGTTNPAILTMNEDKNITAHFV